MKFLLLTLLTVISVFDCFGQNWQWIDYLTGGNANHAVFDVHAGDGDNYMYACGRYRSIATFYGQDTNVVNPYHAGYRDVWLAKIDSSGNFVWVATEGGPNSDFANGIVTDEFGNVYITGNIEDTTYFGSIQAIGDPLGDVFLAKYSPDGVPLWVKVWGGDDWDWGDEIVCDKNGSLYIGGYQTGNYDYDLDTLDDFGYFVQKVDYDGNVIWCQGPTNTTAWSYSVLNELIYKDGFLYFGGGVEDDVWFGPEFVTADNWGNAFVAKMDTTGLVHWVHHYGGVHFDMCQGLALQDSFVYMSGSYASLATFDTIVMQSEPYPPASGSAAFNSRDGFVAKITESGSCVWIRDFKSTNIDQTYSVIVDKAGNVVTTGAYDQFDIYSGTASQSDLKITAFDSDGNQVWELFPTGTYMGQGTILDEDDAGNYVFGGRIKGDYTFQTITLNMSILKFTGIMARLYPPLELGAGDNQSACQADSVWLTIPDCYGSPLTYTWYVDGANLLKENGDSALVLMNGIDSAYCVVSSPYASDTIIYNLTVHSLPVVDLGNDITTCDSIVTLHAGTDGEFYDWGAGPVLYDSTFQVTSSGTYSVEVITTENCIGSDSIQVILVDCSGLNELISDIEIYYTSVSKELWVVTSADIFNLKLYTVEGKLVSIFHSKTSGEKVELGNLESGPYIIVYADQYGNRLSRKLFIH